MAVEVVEVVQVGLIHRTHRQVQIHINLPMAQQQCHCNLPMRVLKEEK